MGLKADVDSEIQQKAKVLENEGFVEKMMQRLVIKQFKAQQLKLTPAVTRRVNNLLVKEYLNEYQGRAAY